MAPPDSQSATTDSTASIPVPTSLVATTPTLPPLTNSLLISHLRTTNALSDLSSLLTDSLARTGWTDRVRALALELLRNGTCDTFPELIEEVLRRAKIPKPDAASQNGRSGGKTTAKTNGASTPTNGVNGSGAITLRDGWLGADGLPDVRIPEKTVEVGVDFLKEKIGDLVEAVGDDGD